MHITTDSETVSLGWIPSGVTITLRSMNYGVRSEDRRQLVMRLCERDGDKCYYCAVVMEFRRRGMHERCKDGDATIEHVIPRGGGGSDHESNMVLACHRCNKLTNDIFNLECEILAMAGRPMDVTAQMRLAVLKRKLNFRKDELKGLQAWASGDATSLTKRPSSEVRVLPPAPSSSDPA